MLEMWALGIATLFTAATASATHHAHHHNHLTARRAANFSTEATTNTSTNYLDSYEYVIVGSGPGGGPLAAELAIAGHSVLLLEAGDDQSNNLNTTVPVFHAFSSEDPNLRWDYFVNHYADLSRQEQDTKFTWHTPSGEYFVGANPPSGSTPLGILYPRAGTLGGCSAHNAEIFMYPFESDWSNIQALTGDDSWSPRNMRTYFERIEKCNYLPDSVMGHGFNGWLTTSVLDLTLILEDLKIPRLILAAATALGKGSLLGGLIDTVTGLAGALALDINAPAAGPAPGVYQVPTSVTADRKRVGSRERILAVANNPKNKLTVRTNSFVTKVRFEGGNGTSTAVGVDFLDGHSLYRADPRSRTGNSGTPYSVNATREIILSAGAFNTPQLLKLSGVGPKAELEQFNIPVVLDAPGVGTNLQDRYEISVSAQASTKIALIKDCTFDMTSGNDPCLDTYEKSAGHGIYGSNGIAVCTVQRTSAAEDDDADIITCGWPAKFLGYFPDYTISALEDRAHWAWAVLKGHTRNKAGTVQLRSADPLDMPLINFNYFDTGTTGDGANSKDLQALLEGVKYGRQVFHSYQSLPNDLIPFSGTFTEDVPGASASTDQELEDYITQNAWGHHASCSCPIGADDDLMAVLDSKFRVRGVNNLRVVDASVFPAIPGFYIAASVYMISEKAAAVILEDLQS